ncbi:peptidylprolyl isomerase family protein [Maudiozyma humilis]|uniref:Peptidylprolyl isomerase family protein n=1 Tax=Maudiozyma humilis TaxID=51915 RepID=A0AAV5RWH9_MAUHU|nr:peptidylprolyl isomerase family protein [Kazachstania humilis]
MLLLQALVSFVLLCSQALAVPASTGIEAKVYAPDPPATHHVLMGIKYYDEDKKKEAVSEIIIDLYGTVAPMAVENFAVLGKGIAIMTDPQAEGTTLVTYKKTKFTKLIKDDIIEGGEVLPGITSFSIFGFKWADEGFFLKHDRPGRVSLVNDGEADTNDSRFSISLNPNGSPERDGKNVVFGQVIYGYDNLEAIQKCAVSATSNRPEHDITISYIIVDELKIADSAKLHQEYMTKLDKFESGDLSQGIKLAPSAATLRENKKLKDMKTSQLNHPLAKVSYGIIFLLVLYLLAKKKRVLFFKSSASAGSAANVVSLRND